MASSNSNLANLVAQLLRDEYQALVRWVAGRVQPQVAEDAVSFALGQLALGLMPEGHPAPLAWVRVVAYREALRLLGQYHGDLPLYEAVAKPSLDADPATLVIQAEERGLLSQIKPDEATALQLQAEGYGHKEIAEKLGWTMTKVNRCISEGRAALRKLRKGGEK